MKSVTFPQANYELAKDQPEYETLHVFAEMKKVEGKEILWSMTACLELSDEEIQEIIKTKRIWHTQMLFGNNFQPIRMSTQNPFE